MTLQVFTQKDLLKMEGTLQQQGAAYPPVPPLSSPLDVLAWLALCQGILAGKVLYDHRTDIVYLIQGNPQ